MQHQRRLATIIECIADSLAVDPATVSGESRLIADLGADSLDFIDILFQLESAFDIKLQKEDLQLLPRLEMGDEAVQDGLLTAAAKQRLRAWLPSLPQDRAVKPQDLGDYITVETLAKVVAERLAMAGR